MSQVIPPGGRLGILGSGQLGRMLAAAARRLGYAVQIYSPDADTPAGQLADLEWPSPYDDFDKLRQFAQQVDVVTLEFENIEVAALNELERFVPVRPGPQVLHETQNRLREKRMLRRLGIPTAPFLEIRSFEELKSGVAELGGTGVLKTADWGYDGKGQRIVRPGDDLETIWRDFDGQSAILEGFVDFDAEISVIAARGTNGEIRTYVPFHNSHSHHILDVTVSPVEFLSLGAAQRAEEIARTIMSALDVIGVLCVEMFLTKAGDVLVNELAPRPHNSGHLTIDAHETCQFEQQLRAVCGLPLGSMRQRQPAAMVNLLGDLWRDGRAPHWPAVLQQPDVKLHLYGKSEARNGRKMGHLTALADSPREAEELARSARARLTMDGN